MPQQFLGEVADNTYDWIMSDIYEGASDIPAHTRTVFFLRNILRILKVHQDPQAVNSLSNPCCSSWKLRVTSAAARHRGFQHVRRAAGVPGGDRAGVQALRGELVQPDDGRVQCDGDGGRKDVEFMKRGNQSDYELHTRAGLLQLQEFQVVLELVLLFEVGRRRGVSYITNPLLATGCHSFEVDRKGSRPSKACAERAADFLK